MTELESVVGRSPAGDRVQRHLRRDGAQAIATAILRSGWMADQIRSLRRLLERGDDGYECSRPAAQAAAPQLVGLLARMPDVALTNTVVIGRETAIELDSVWNETPPPARIDWQNIEQRRKAIGERAELYSIQLERTAGPGAIDRIRWVSRDDDSFGYDIEVAAARSEPSRPLESSTRRIEVKGSSGPKVQFFLSANEYTVAGRYGEAYEVHFWGEIDVRRDPMLEYEVLRSAGYPIVVRDPAAALPTEPWVIEPSQYRVTRSS